MTFATRESRYRKPAYHVVRRGGLGNRQRKGELSKNTNQFKSCILLKKARIQKVDSWGVIFISVAMV